jgi:hypothetical protein
MSFWRTGKILFLLFAFVCQAGCGGTKIGPVADPAEANKKSELAQIHELLVTYAKSHQQQPPKTLADLQKFEKINPLGIRALKDQSIILLYGLASDGGPSTILAYEKDADKNGGLALMANGAVKKVSADEVKAAAAKK